MSIHKTPLFSHGLNSVKLSILPTGSIGVGRWEVKEASEISLVSLQAFKKSCLAVQVYTETFSALIH
jgi:hypothetical protein